MRELDTFFTEALNELSKPEFALPLILSEELKKKGLVLSNRQNNRLKKQIQQKKTISLKIRIHQLRNSQFADENDLAEFLKAFEKNLDIEIEKYCDKMLDAIPDITEKSIVQLGDKTVVRLLKTFNRIDRKKSREHNKVKKLLMRNWSGDLRTFRMLLYICEEMFEIENARADRNSPKSEALTRISAQACLISSEIYLLCLGGYAEGALSRWRTLHELSVIMSFLKDNDEQLAERFLAHVSVSDFKSLGIFNEKADRLGFERIAGEQEALITQQYADDLGRYGESFKYDFGWASSVIDKKKITFRDIEEVVSLDHLRPYYKLACSYIHTRAKGLLYKIGLLQEHQGYILTGLSAVGLEDPIQLTVISLTNIFVALLTNEVEFGRLVQCRILQKIVDDYLESVSSKYAL